MATASRSIVKIVRYFGSGRWLRFVISLYNLIAIVRDRVFCFRMICDYVCIFVEEVLPLLDEVDLRKIRAKRLPRA